MQQLNRPKKNQIFQKLQGQQLHEQLMEVKWIQDDQLNNDESDRADLKVEMDDENEHEIVHLQHEENDKQLEELLGNDDKRIFSLY